MFFCLLGGREAGKSYSVMQWAVRRKMRLGDKFKFYWLRLTDAQADKLKKSGADKLVDPDLKRKYNVNTFTRGDEVFTYTPITDEETGKEKRIDIKSFCTILSCSTMYNCKGVGYFDNEYDGEYCIVLDEMQREAAEKNTFDIVYSFVNMLENLIRSTKTKVKVIMIGNTLNEASDILSAFNFIPDGFGRYKLKSKRCVVDYIKPSEKYLARRKGTAADIVLPNASTFTNEIDIDRSLLVNKRLCQKPQYVVKFTSDKESWFTVWNDNIIKPYNKEDCRIIAMRKYLDEIYDTETMNMVFQQFNMRNYRFTNLAVLKRFQKNLKLLKK